MQEQAAEWPPQRQRKPAHNHQPESVAALRLPAHEDANVVDLRDFLKR